MVDFGPRIYYLEGDHLLPWSFFWEACTGLLWSPAVTMSCHPLVAPTFSTLHCFAVTFLVLLLTGSNVNAAKYKRQSQLDQRPTGKRVLPRRNAARSQSCVHPCSMVEGHSGDNESVLPEEVDVDAMNEDEQGITAEGKDQEIFIAKMFNRHSYGEKEYNPPKKFHIGKATLLPKEKNRKCSGTTFSMKMTTLKQ